MPASGTIESAAVTAAAPSLASTMRTQATTPGQGSARRAGVVRAVSVATRAGRRRTPAPAPRAGSRGSGAAAPISASRSSRGEASGRSRASRAASTATRAAAAAPPPTTAAAFPGTAVRAAPGAASPGTNPPPAAGPRLENGDSTLPASASPEPARVVARCRHRAAGARPAVTSPTSTATPASSSSTAAAAAPVTPSTGAAIRPAGIAGSGRRRGSASSTARAPAAAAAAARATGSSPARTTTSLPRRLPAPRASNSRGIRGFDRPGRLDPSGWREARQQHRAASVGSADLQVDARDALRRRQRADGERIGRRGGRADGALRPGGRALLPGRRQDQRAERGGATTARASGEPLEGRVGRVDADERDRDVVVGGAVAVGVDGALEPREQLVGGRDLLEPRALRRGLQAGDADRQHALAGGDEDAGQRGAAGLAPPAARIGRRRRVVVAVDGVVAGLQPAGEQRMAGVDAAVEHRDRRPAERRGGDRQPQPGHAGGSLEAG